MLITILGCGGSGNIPWGGIVTPTPITSIGGATPTPISALPCTFSPISVKLYVTPVQTVIFSATPNESGCTYTWNATDGSITSGTDASFSWQAPASVGYYTVSVSVTKGNIRADNTWAVYVQNSVTFSFFVASAPDYNPLSGVLVQLIGTGTGTYEATTAADGIAVLNNVPAGVFVCKVTKSGYRTTYVPVSLPTGATNPGCALYSSWTAFVNSVPSIKPAPDQSKSLIMIMTTDYNNTTPISGASVSISPSTGRLFYGNEAGTDVDPSLSSTAQYGVCLITDVENGTYTISATKTGYTFQTIKINITETANYIYYLKEQL